MAIKVTIFLPEKDNDGRDLSAEIRAFEDECWVAFGGWTLVGYFKGVWRMESGARQTDINVVYMVVVEDDELSHLEAIVRSFKSKTTQEKIFVEVAMDADIRFI